MKTISKCEGHPSSEFDPAGKTLFCDGSCNQPDCDMHQPLLQSAEDQRRDEQNESPADADALEALDQLGDANERNV